MYNKIQKQLEVLNIKIRFFGRTKVEDHLKALDQIGELGAPYDAQYVIHHIFSDNKLILQKTVTVIRKLLTKREIRIARLNLYSSFSYYYGYGSLNKKSLKKFEHYHILNLSYG